MSPTDEIRRTALQLNKTLEKNIQVLVEKLRLQEIEQKGKKEWVG